MNAVELLSKFGAQGAEQYAQYFQFSEESAITGAEIHAVGVEATTAKYSGRDEDVYKVVNNILRITTADGFEGVSGVDSYAFGTFSDAHAVELQSAVEDLVAAMSLDPVEVGRFFERTRPELSDSVRASIDIALWDLAARRAAQPLYALLGMKRESMEPYASLPFYETLPEYVDAVNEYAELGYNTFKFHVWGEVEKDVRLVQLIQETFAGSSYRFMIDLESAYGIDDAQRLGKVMDAGLFVLFEAPVDDALHDVYAELRQDLSVDVIPAGYVHYSPDYLEQGIKAGAWDAGRFDATTVGGVSNSLELLILANDAELPIEIQSWGHTLTQVVNLHLMLANDLTEYFEAPAPKEAYEFGMQDGNLVHEGRAILPDAPGLGVQVDWDRLALADFHVHFALEFAL